MDFLSERSFEVEWRDGLLMMLFLGVVGLFVWASYLKSRSQQLKQREIPEQQSNLKETMNLASQIRAARSGSSEQQGNQREVLQSLETVVVEHLRETGFSNASEAITPSILPTRTMDEAPYERGGVQFTIKGVPVPYLAETLHRLEKQIPAVKTLRIEFNELTNKGGTDVVKNGSIQLMYYLPTEQQ